MEKALIELYKHIFSQKKNEPTWATHKNTQGHSHELIHCPVPFVGKYYGQQKPKILLYASAENLSDYNSSGKTYLDCDDYAINRHRNFFDSSAANPDVFFPNVHIQPINDGCLAIAALYVYQKFQGVDNISPNISPADFLERIAFANYCKYTIQSATNQDYAHNGEYLKESHAYITQDLAILKPDYIIMPKTIYWADQKFIDGLKGTAKIIPIYQINARNINLRIKNWPKRSEAELSPALLDWCRKLGEHGITGKTKENFFSVFSYLDHILQNEMR